MYYYGYGMDPTYILVLIGVIICMAASSSMNATFRKYARVRSHNQMTGREAAEQILRSQGITDVRIEQVAGNLTDHYDPSHKVLRLSSATYNATSVAAIGVAAHECGHAIQHAEGYTPLSLRSAFVPIANFGSKLAWPLILIGFLFNSSMSVFFLELGILAFLMAVLFQIITLPVEFNASNRALQLLKSNGMLYDSEVKDVQKVLKAAAMTYVASAAAAILQLLRIIILARGRRDD